MPTNDFKPFAIAPGANVLSQADYNALAAVSTGWQGGVAKSAEVNKAVRQATFIASALAQFIANVSGNDVLDNGNSQALINNLTLALNNNGDGNYLRKDKFLSEIFNAGSDAIAEAKWNLLLQRFVQTDGDTQVKSPSGNQYLFVANNAWGVFDATTSGAIPLPVGTGGTGATSASGARTNLGLGDASTKNTGTASGTVAAGDDARITGAMQKANNLSDIASYSTARSNMGLKGAALLDVGTAAGTVAAGDDSRITGAVQKASNLSDLPSASSARGNLGLGTAATANVGTGANQIPDMSSFTRGSGYFKLPNGIIVQYMQAATKTSAASQVLYPIAFPSTVFCVLATAIDVDAPNYMAANVFTPAACLLSAYTNSGNVRAATGAFIIAIGI